MNGKVFYNFVWTKAPGQWRARHNLTTVQHQAVLDQAKQDGLKPVNVSVVSVNGQRRYTVLYWSDSIGSWQLKSPILESDYQRIFDENKQSGCKPIYLNAYVHDGRPLSSLTDTATTD